MDALNKLVEYFSEFPGIGPRQARRFVYFLLTRNSGFIGDFSRQLTQLKSDIVLCPSCFRFFLKKDARAGNLCNICGSPNRNASLLMIVSRDVDLENIEKTHTYDGYYFVLGGSVPVLDKNPEDRVRAKDLLKKIEKSAFKEIIFALNANAEGENTQYFLEKLLAPHKEKLGLTFSTLGRGLSTGTELEYSDSETIKNALKNRSTK